MSIAICSVLNINNCSAMDNLLINSEDFAVQNILEEITTNIKKLQKEHSVGIKRINDKLGPEKAKHINYIVMVSFKLYSKYEQIIKH